MRKALALFVLLAVGGCVETEVFVLKNPKTDEIVQCRGNNSGPALFPIVQANMDNAAARDCAKGYQAAGWILLNKPSGGRPQ